MSPEQWVAMMELHEGRPITSTVDGRSDIYALGVMLYEMLGARSRSVSAPRSRCSSAALSRSPWDWRTS